MISQRLRRFQTLLIPSLPQKLEQFSYCVLSGEKIIQKREQK